MIKKILIILSLVYLFTSSVSAYETNMTVDVTLKDQDYPLSWYWLVISVGGWKESKVLLTDKSWKLNFNYLFNSDSTDSITILVNWNYISLNKITSDFKWLTINYNNELQSIREVSWNWANISFTNQEIKQSTNYKLLLVYIFFSLLTSTILLWWRYIYNSLNKDIYKHKNY